MQARYEVDTSHITIDKEGEKPAVIYTANIQSKTMYCGGMVNYMEQLDNLSYNSGTFSSGFNATAFLQPGANTLDIWMFPIGSYEKDYTFRENDKCHLALYGAFENGTKREMSSLTVTVDDGEPTIEGSKEYPIEYQTPLANTEKLVDGNLTEFRRPIHIKTIPRWRWVDAQVFDKHNREHRKKLRYAYNALIKLLEARDYGGLEMAYSLSSREKAKADGYFSSPNDFFNSLAIESKFNESSDTVVQSPREWSEYTLKSFMGGKLVRMEDKRGHSPLRILSEDNNWVYTITPYFSIIDDRVVISR